MLVPISNSVRWDVRPGGPGRVSGPSWVATAQSMRSTDEASWRAPWPSSGGHGVRAQPRARFCTRNKGGAKELAGEIDLPPGAKVQRTVTQKDGKLVLARPQ